MLLCFHISYGQNYRQYYQIVDSAFYFYKTGENLKADSLYQKAFDLFIGFPDDYTFAACNIYSIDRSKSNVYLGQAFKYGQNCGYVEFIFKNNSLNYSSKEIKKLSKKNKEKILKGTNNSKIVRMVIKDQFPRFFLQKKISRNDSINFLKIKDMMINDSLLFNRFYTGYRRNFFWDLILIHMSHRFDRFKEISPNYIRFIEKGWMERENFAYNIDIITILNGHIIKIDEKTGIIVELPEKNHYIMDDELFYSLSGNFSFYSSRLKKQVTVPIHPDMTPEMVDKFRRSIFLGSYEMYKKSHPHKLYPTIDEFKNIYNKRKTN